MHPHEIDAPRADSGDPGAPGRSCPMHCRYRPSVFGAEAAAGWRDVEVLYVVAIQAAPGAAGPNGSVSAAAWRAALTNLIDNAVRHAPASRPVTTALPHYRTTQARPSSVKTAIPDPSAEAVARKMRAGSKTDCCSAQFAAGFNTRSRRPS